MKQIIIIITFLTFGYNVSAQSLINDPILQKVERLLERHTKDAELLFNRINPNDYRESKDWQFQYHYISGLLAYQQGAFDNAIEELASTIVELDNRCQWDCENYLKVAYYLADSYIKKGKNIESEQVINYALIKCVSIYDTCIYAKKMYQLLLYLLKDMDNPTHILEQIHNEIQKIAINIYASNAKNKNGEDVQKHFLYWYNYITNPLLSAEDSIMMYKGKAAYLYEIEEYEEAIRLFEYVKEKSPKEGDDYRRNNESLLIMYSATANIKEIEKLLFEMYSYGEDPYLVDCVVGSNLFYNNYYELAQKYFERSDSFLNINKNLPDWKGKKRNILSKLIINSHYMNAPHKTIDYCNEYKATILEMSDYEDLHYTYYYQGLALITLEKYEEAIDMFNILLSNCAKAKNDDSYVEINNYLGVCYIKMNQSGKSIRYLMSALDAYKQKNMDNVYLLQILNHNIGKAYLDEKKYKDALHYLNTSADIQVKINGIISEKTQSYINQCKNH